MEVKVYRLDTIDKPLATLILSAFEIPRVGDYIVIQRTELDKEDSNPDMDSFGSNVKKVRRNYAGHVLQDVSIIVE